MPHTTDASGILIIPDMHLAGHTPGRRRDADYPGTVLAKLDWALNLANARNLAPVQTGDLVHRPIIASEATKSRFARTLRRSRRKLTMNLGNHDPRGTRLADGDTVRLLVDADLLDVVEDPDIRVITGSEGRIVLLLVPYHAEIPRDITPFVTPDTTDTVVAVTHHDLVFPDSETDVGADLRPIREVGLAVNGHVHQRRQPVLRDETVWHNPGSLTRLKVDEIEHAPSVLEIRPSGDVIEHTVPHEAPDSIMDFTGSLVPADAARSDSASPFVAELTRDERDARATDEATLVAEMIEERFEADETPEPARAIIRDLLQNVAT